MRLLEFFRPYRVIVTRRVTEEEQVSVEGFHRSRESAEVDLQSFLAIFRDHRRATNQEVVKATQQQLASLDAAIKARGDECHTLDETIEAKKLEVAKMDLAIRQRQNKLAVAK